MGLQTYMMFIDVPHLLNKSVIFVRQ